MGLYRTIATDANLAEYLVIDIGDLTDDQKRMLKRANEFVIQTTMGRADFSNEIHLEALKLAACAQVEYWTELGEQIGTVTSESLDDMASSYDSKKNLLLSERGRGYLMYAGLMYRGMNNACFISNRHIN